MSHLVGGRDDALHPLPPATASREIGIYSLPVQISMLQCPLLRVRVFWTVHLMGIAVGWSWALARIVVAGVGQCSSYHVVFGLFFVAFETLVYALGVGTLGSASSSLYLVGTVGMWYLVLDVGCGVRLLMEGNHVGLSGAIAVQVD